MYPEEANRPKWAVVGGGMLGLTLAYRLAKQGIDVTLLEAAPSMGGLTSGWKLGEATWERFYHVTLLSDERLRHLLDEIDLAEDLRWAETKTGFYTNGQLYSMSNTAEFLNFPPLRLIEKLRLGGTIFYASRIRNWKRLEGMPVAKWLERWSGKGTFQKIWLPLLRAKLGDSYQNTAASFIWAHINRMYAARRSGLKKEMFGYVRGGYCRIIERLTEKLEQLGAQLRVSHAIEAVSKQEDGRFEVRCSGRPAETFDRVIMTTPSHVVARTCGDLTAKEIESWNRIEYLGIVCASLLLKKSLSPYYVTNLTDDWVPMTAVIELTNIVDTAELANHSLVYLPKYVPANHPLFEKSDDEIEADFLQALERMYPDFRREDVAAFRVARTRSVMAIPTLNYSENLSPMKSSVDGLYIVNNAHIVKGNLNVNETIRIAEEAMQGPLADDIRQAIGQSRRAEPVAVALA